MKKANNNQLSCSSVCIVIVTYNPKLVELSETISRLNNDDLSVCIVDNSDKEKFRLITSTFRNQVRDLIQIGCNIGIAAAQNIGIERAFNSGYEAVVLLDQDSIISRCLIEKMIVSLTKLETAGKRVACIGPLVHNRDDTNQKYVDGNKESNLIEVDKILSSGTLIRKDVFNDVGKMDELLFIDLVDWEWCWRAKSKGYKVFIDTSASLPHRLGEGRKKIFGSVYIGIPSPIRHYYQLRNYLILVNRKYVPKSFKMKYAIVNLVKFIYFPAFISPRRTRWCYMKKGFLDYIKNRRVYKQAK